MVTTVHPKRASVELMTPQKSPNRLLGDVVLQNRVSLLGFDHRGLCLRPL